MGSAGETALDYDVLIIGAGLSGIFSLYRMRGLGLKTRVLEYGTAEGGTWYWNRYPGCEQDTVGLEIKEHTDISQVGSIQKATLMLLRSIKKFSMSGRGLSISHRNQKPCVTQTF